MLFLQLLEEKLDTLLYYQYNMQNHLIVQNIKYNNKNKITNRQHVSHLRTRQAIKQSINTQKFLFFLFFKSHPIDTVTLWRQMRWLGYAFFQAP